MAVYNTLGEFLRARGACGLIDRALPAAERDPRLGDLWIMLVYNRVSLGADLGGYEQARKLALDALARGELSGSPRLRRLHGMVAGIAYETGDWDEALAEHDASGEAGIEGHLTDPYLPLLIAGHRDESLATEDEPAGGEPGLDSYAPPAGADVHNARYLAALAVLEIASRWDVGVAVGQAGAPGEAGPLSPRPRSG